MNIIIDKSNIKVIRKKIKHTYIRVKKGEIIITTNYLTPQLYLNALVKKNIKEIEKMMEQDKKRYDKENTFSLFGKKYDLVYDEGLAGVVIDDGIIRIKNEKVLNKYLDNIINEIFE